jgi:small-conductance mechanosensitive channel
VEFEMMKILQGYLDGLMKSLPRILLSVIVFFFFWFIANRVRNVIKKRGHLLKIEDIMITNFVGSLVKGLIIIIGFSISMNIIGLSGIASGLITGAGVSAVVLGFAFKNVGENLVSGFMLIISRPFNTGDFISVLDITGTIVSMNMKSTDVRTIDGKMIYIPNSLIVNNPLINYTAEGKRRFDFTVELDVSNDSRMCRAIMKKVLDEVPEILKEPAPVVTLSELGANIKIKAYYWLQLASMDRSILEINSDAVERCKDEFERAGIELADISDLKITNDKISVELVK